MKSIVKFKTDIKNIRIKKKQQKEIYELGN